MPQINATSRPVLRILDALNDLPVKSRNGSDLHGDAAHARSGSDDLTESSPVRVVTPRK